MNSTTDIGEIAGAKFRALPMDGRRQFHVATKLAAVAASFGDLGNPMKALAQLSPDDSDFVINECLRVVEREVPGAAAWAPIMTPQGLITDDDIRTSMATILQLVIPVIEANVQAFLSELPKGYLAALVVRLMANLSKSSD